MPVSFPPMITTQERQARVVKLCALMAEQGSDAVLLSASTNLRYFTGINWHLSERFLGAIIHADGAIDYVAPHFELDKVGSLISLPGEVMTWQEEDNPYAKIARRMGDRKKLALDDQLPIFMYRQLRAELDEDRLPDAGPMATHLRSRKSPAEIALMTRAKEITLEVHKRAHANLKEGMLASEVAAFIDQQHRELAEAWTRVRRRVGTRCTDHCPALPRLARRVALPQFIDDDNGLLPTSRAPCADALGYQIGAYAALVGNIAVFATP